MLLKQLKLLQYRNNWLECAIEIQCIFWLLFTFFFYLFPTASSLQAFKYTTGTVSQILSAEW